MSGYDFAINQSGLLEFQGLSSAEQRVLLGIFTRLAGNPALKGDYSYRDENGRDNEVLDLDGFVVTYWTDHAAKEVRILGVERT